MFPSESELKAATGSDEFQFIGDSECVAAVKFVDGTLTIQFQQYGTYEFYRVHPFVYYNLLRATSKGYFFNRNIRSKGYQFSRVG
jgi:KTSC domain